MLAFEVTSRPAVVVNVIKRKTEAASVAESPVKKKKKKKKKDAIDEIFGF
jgi:hypothetical protein